MKVRKFLLFFCLLILVLCPVSVYARNEVDAIKFIEKNAEEITTICTNANSKVGSLILSYTPDDGLVSFSNKGYKKLSSDKKEIFMEYALLYAKESGLTANVKNKLYNFIAEQDGTTAAAIKYLSTDTSADFVTAGAWLKPFTGVIGTILGILCLLIFLFLTMSVVVDIAYLVLPGFQMLCERGEDHRKPFVISREAYTALRDCERSVEYRSVMSIYFKRRVGTVIMIAVALLYLISGQIYDLMSWFMDSFGSIISF